MNKKLKTILSLSAASLIITSALVGCGSQKSQSSNNGGESSKKTLKVTMALGEDEWKVMKSDIFPEFEKQNNCKVEAIQMEAGDVIKKLEAMKRANSMDIDFIAQSSSNTYQLVQKGLVEDLSQYKGEIPSTVIPILLKPCEFNNKMYFMPFRPNVQINYYNENKFKQYGLETPKNWDDLLKAAKTFKEKEGTGRIAVQMDSNQIFAYIKQAGGDPLVLNDEGCIKAYSFYKEIWPYLSPDTVKADWNTTNKFLADESVYYAENWPFGVNIIVKDAGKKEIKAYSGFSGPVKASKAVGGDVIGIPAGAPNRELALKFMKYLMSKEVQEKLVCKLGWPSYRTDAYGEVEEWQKPYFEAVVNALKVAELRPTDVPYWSDVNKCLKEALKEITIDGKPVKETLDKYHNVLEEVKKKAGN